MEYKGFKNNVLLHINAHSLHSQAFQKHSENTEITDCGTLFVDFLSYMLCKSMQ